jgi:hypothetical protein
MKKKTAPPALPPLPRHVLEKVEEIERYAAKGLTACWGPLFLNTQKAMRLLRSCVVDSFECQAGYYSTLPTRSPEWILILTESTLESLVGLIDVSSPVVTVGGSSSDGIKLELLTTLSPAIEKFRAKFTSPETTEGIIHKRSTPGTEDQSGKPHAPNLEELMERAAGEMDLNHSELARRIGIGKTTYFAVKGGGGKRSTRIKVERYLTKHLQSLS